MGFSTREEWNVAMDKRTIPPDQTHPALRNHPNFEMPPAPESSDPQAVADWVIATVAAYISPPKVEGEDAEFSCINIADAIRGRLGPEIKNVLSGIGSPPSPLRP
jgi:hypothetical protein